MEDQLEVFLQGPGIASMALIKVPVGAKVGDIIEVARGKGLKLEDEQSARVWLENAEEPLNSFLTLQAAGVQSRSRVQIHTCQRIHVTVNFNNESKQHPFAPSATIRTIKEWADQKFGLSATDATEHELQVCGSTVVPVDDTEIGALTQPSECSACFDLVPKQRVEG